MELLLLVVVLFLLLVRIFSFSELNYLDSSLVVEVYLVVDLFLLLIQENKCKLKYVIKCATDISLKNKKVIGVEYFESFAWAFELCKGLELF